MAQNVPNLPQIKPKNTKLSLQTTQHNSKVSTTPDLTLCRTSLSHVLISNNRIFKSQTGCQLKTKVTSTFNTRVNVPDNTRATK